LFDAQKRLNEITLEIKGLETGKQTLVNELQRVGNELLERANRIASSPPLPDYNKLLINTDEEEMSATESLPVHETEIRIPQQESIAATNEIEVEQIAVQEAAKEEVIVASNPAPVLKSSTGSFFDQLN